MAFRKPCGCCRHTQQSPNKNKGIILTSFQRWNIIGDSVCWKLIMQVKYIQKHRLKAVFLKLWSPDNVIMNNIWCLFNRQRDESHQNTYK